MKHLTDRDWGSVVKDFKASDPFNYAVLDDFLAPQTLATLRSELIKAEGWQRRDIPHENNGTKWIMRQLFIGKPDVPLIAEIARELQESLPTLLKDKILLNYWAIFCNRNEGVFSHCDGGAISLNLWLTPTQFNEDPNSGGLVLFDVKRTVSMSPFDYASERGGCVSYVNERTRGGLASVPYRYNRALFFDAWTFHATEIVKFTGDSMDTARLNLTLSFDNPLDS